MAWMRNYIPYKIVDVIIYPCLTCRHLRYCDSRQLVDVLWRSPSIRPVTWSNSIVIDRHGAGRTYLWEQYHDDVIKWKHFPRSWPFVKGIHWSPVVPLTNDNRFGALIWSLLLDWTNRWINSRVTGDSRHLDTNVTSQWCHDLPSHKKPPISIVALIAHWCKKFGWGVHAASSRQGLTSKYDLARFKIQTPLIP